MDHAAEHGSFLGSEFLLWLWFQAETEGGEFQSTGHGMVGVAFDGVLELSSPVSEGKVTVRGDLPTRLPEAQAALLGGRVPSLARLIMAWGEDSVGVTIDAATFDLRSLRIVAEIPEEAEERAALLLEVPELLDGLYQAFLEVRFGTKWRSTTLPAIRAWIRDRVPDEAAEAAAG